MARFPRIPSASQGRRSFLAHLGLWGSAVVAGANSSRLSATTPGAAVSPLNAEGRIGVLLPQAALCGGLDESLLAGFQTALQQARDLGGDFRIEVLRAETRLSPSSYRKAALNLLGKEQADLIIALAQPGMVSEMGPVFEEAGRCLVVVDGGANLVRPGEAGRNVFFNTLGHWESAWALGRWAATTFGGEGFLVVSGFESGHDALQAFRLGVEATGSGERGFCLPRVPVNQTRGDLPAASTVDRIRLAAPSYVVAMLDRTEGLEFLRAFQDAGLAGRIPLVGSAFLAEQAAAAGLGAVLSGFTAASAWTPGLASSTNRAFLADYARRTRKEADGFAALGFDTGRMLLAALQDSGGHARFLREALERVAWDGPGGHRAMDFSSHSATGDIHLIRFNGVRPSVLRSEPGLGNQAQEIAGLRGSARPALLNPYPIY